MDTQTQRKVITMPNTHKEELTIWGAITADGRLIKSSVGTFRSVANRWALKRGNSEVIKLGSIKAPLADEGKTEGEKPVRGRPRKAVAQLRESPKRNMRGPKPRQPRKKDVTQTNLEVPKNDQVKE